jgi:hypothetical protein
MDRRVKPGDDTAIVGEAADSSKIESYFGFRLTFAV